MSAIRERTALCSVDLPKKLTSRRNLLAHFSKFGDVKNVSVNKKLRSCVIYFSSHYDAQAAKTQGNLFEGESLKLFWSESTTLDPRAKARQDDLVDDTEPLWQDDDKECFGVESVKSNVQNECKPSTGVMKKISGFKKTLNVNIKPKEVNTADGEMVSKSPIKLGRVVNAKTQVILKKRVLNPVTKRKISMKGDEKVSVVSVSSKPNTPTVLQNQILKSTSPSTEDQTDLKHKLKLLDERDKLIRRETIQDSDIKTAVIIKGTCPDMCPERERILRQCRFAISTYEMFPGTNKMDENRAVKEYSRSSADQEVPLPHDLRPGPVLSMTMSYLITNVINLVDNHEENKAVWYSFCLNRLRSIRKDINMQQLCDIETVRIVEQCARFYISCYDHMCGVGVSGFDEKLNTHNLIDCLQTLQHMYEDLSKHNVVCPNEAEFNSYLILLKLTTGDVMCEYQKYSLQMQLSPQIQFAIETYMAFKNNMYSKFFNLVKRASYLTSCLMQRYFEKVRTEALKIMFKAYCRSGKTVGLTSSFIVSSLKFDSQTMALKFCEREKVELKIDFSGNEQDDSVSTSSFLIREKRLPMAYAVVGDSNLPCYVKHEVSSSFDEYGKLKDPLLIASDENESSFSAYPSHSEEENTEVNIPETNNVQQANFKFSLSSTKVTDSIFGKSLPSNSVMIEDKQPTDEDLIKDEESLLNLSNYPGNDFLDSSRLVDTIENSEDLESVQMEQDVTYEDDKMEQEPARESAKQLLIPQYNPFKATNLEFPESSLSPSVNTTKISPFIKGKENKNANMAKTYFPVKHFNDIVVINKDKNNDNFSFSFPTPKSELVRSFSEEYGQNINKNNKTHHNRDRVSSTFKFDIAKQDHNEQTQTVINQLGVTGKMNIQFLQDGLKQPLFQVNNDIESSAERQEYSIAEDTEKQKKSLLLEKLLKETAEKEKLKIEEKRLELENEKKRIEEQESLKKLKKDLSQRLKAINARKYARHWKQRVEKLKQTRADFPMLVQLSVNKHLSLWGKVNSIPTNSIFQRAKDRRASTKTISQLLNSGITESCKYIGSDIAEALAKTAAKTMKKGVITPVYWKLAISVPWASRASSELSVFNQLMRGWCKQSFYRDVDTHFGKVESIITSLKIPVNISIHFSDDLQSSHDFKGMDALVFVVLNESESEKMCLQRLRSLLSFQMKSSKFSVAVMNVNGNKLERVLKMELEELHEQNLIAYWSINPWSSPNSIVESLNFLTQYVNVVPYICSTTLELLVNQVSEEFFDSLSSGQHLSTGLMGTIRNPNHVIYLYNICLTKLEDLLMSSKLEKYFNFGKEFKMHVPLNESGGPELMCGKQYDDIYRSQISRKISSMKLPEFSGWPPKSQNRLVKMFKTYCNKVHNMGVFPQVIRMLDLPDDSDLQSHLEQVSWLNIVEIWAQCSIKHAFPDKDKNKQMFVIFNKNDVQRMIKKQWWLKLPVVQLKK